MINRLAAVILLLCSVCVAEDPKLSSKELDKLVNGIVSWTTDLNSTGTKIELREALRSQKDGRVLVSYDVYVTGAPQNQKYAVFQWPVTSPEPQMVLPSVAIASDGQLCYQANPKCVNPIQFALAPVKGEVFRTLLISENGKYKATALVIPNPIIGVDQECGLEVVRLAPEFEAALVRGRGFKPNESVQFTSDSAGERRDGTTKADGKGNFNLVLAPFAKHKKTGLDNVFFKASACTPAISFKWGTTKE